MEVQHGLIKMFGRVGDGEWCGLVFVCLRCVDRGFLGLCACINTCFYVYTPVIWLICSGPREEIMHCCVFVVVRY